MAMLVTSDGVFDFIDEVRHDWMVVEAEVLWKVDSKLI
jgi:hypothetical protein